MGFLLYNRYKTTKMDKKFDLRDIAIIPTIQSDISSRSECSITTGPFYGDTLPLIASPMDTVVCEKNYQAFIDHGIIPCLPRGLSSKHLVGTPHYFQAFGLCEIETQLEWYKQQHHKELFELLDDTKDEFWHFPNVLIDIANGHMAKLLPIIKDIKTF